MNIRRTEELMHLRRGSGTELGLTTVTRMSPQADDRFLAGGGRQFRASAGGSAFSFSLGLLS